MTSSSTAERTPLDRHAFRAPAAIGRYVLGESLGRGGQGEVFSAYDVELQRSVAIKILQPDGSSPRDEVVRREARALARLDHPNVVVVHDVGRCKWDADRSATYLVLELVEGQRIDRWVAAEPRSIDDVLDVMLQVGEGLRAAHERGLVHGDLKPSNVLVSDRGVAKVLDFGLARALAETEGDADDVSRPHNAGWGGTPEYMAPEQHRGNANDALSDQYAYSLCFFEALLGYRLFGGYTRTDLGTVKHIGPSPTPNRGTPRWLTRILRRGMAVRTVDRFDSMATLLERIRRARARHRWVRRGVRAAVLVAAVSVLGTQVHRWLAELRCEQAVRPGPEWTEGVVPGEPSAVATTVATALDRDVRALHKQRLAACTRYGGHPPPEVATCLDGVERWLNAIDVVRQGSLGEDDRLAYLVSLEARDPSACFTDAPPVQTDPDDADGTWTTVVLEADALQMAGRFPEARRRLEPWLGTLPPRGWARARAEFVYGWSAFRTGDAEAADRHLRRAIDAADAIGDERMRLSFLLHLMTVTRSRGRIEAAAELQRHVATRAEQLGDARLLAEYEFHSALLDVDEGDPAAAMARFDRALQGFEANLPAAHPYLGFTFTAMGAVARRAGRDRDAERYLEEARRRLTVGLGPSDARIAAVHLNLSNLMFDEGRFGRCEIELRRALAILAARRQVHAQPDTEGLARTNLGEAALLQGRFADALAEFDQVSTAVRRGNTRWASLRARTLVELGLADEAADLLRSFVAEAELAEPAASVDLAVLRCELGRAELFAGRPGDARRVLEPAYEVLRRRGPTSLSAAHCGVLLERSAAAEGLSPVDVEIASDRFVNLRRPDAVRLLIEILELDPSLAVAHPVLVDEVLRATDPKVRPEWAWLHAKARAVASRAR